VIDDERILAWQNNCWQKAVEPLHKNPANRTMGLGMSFAKTVADTLDCKVGLIQTAVGGTSILRWQPKSGDLFEAAIAEFQAAFDPQTMEICGILWHQGERESRTDLPTEASRCYEAYLEKTVFGFFEALQVQSVPFIVGELGQFINPQRYDSTLVVRDLRAAAQKYPFIAFVSSQGLTDRGDLLHFDAASQREFGRRYAEAYLRMIGA